MKENFKSKKELMRDLLNSYDKQEENKKKHKCKAETKVLDYYTRKLELELKNELWGGGVIYARQIVFNQK